jgi:hypothetical protein
MSINLLGKHNDHDQEAGDSERRRVFIARMERKLEFKQSLQHPHYHRYLIR